MIASDALYRRLIASDAAYTAARLGVIAERPGNPFGVAMREDDGIHGFACRTIPTPSFNRVIGLSERAADEVPEIAAWFDGAGSRGRVELVAGWEGPSLSRALALHGWLWSRSAAIAGAMPAQALAAAPMPAASVRIETVTSPAVMDLFLETHLAGWGIPPEHWRGAKQNMARWLGLPGWTMLLARVDGMPAATAVLCVADRVAYFADAATRPPMRGRGAHAALLHRRLQLAVQAGCDIAWSTAAFPSGSYRNMCRAGLCLIANVSIWDRGN
jgi:hypothetical protein